MALACPGGECPGSFAFSCAGGECPDDFGYACEAGACPDSFAYTCEGGECPGTLAFACPGGECPEAIDFACEGGACADALEYTCEGGECADSVEITCDDSGCTEPSSGAFGPLIMQGGVVIAGGGPPFAFSFEGPPITTAEFGRILFGEPEPEVELVQVTGVFTGDDFFSEDYDPVELARSGAEEVTTPPDVTVINNIPIDRLILAGPDSCPSNHFHGNANNCNGVFVFDPDPLVCGHGTATITIPVSQCPDL